MSVDTRVYVFYQLTVPTTFTRTPLESSFGLGMKKSWANSMSEASVSYSSMEKRRKTWARTIYSSM